MSKRILVTGGAGFLGSHLCEKLLDEGNDVICVDNMISGQIDNIQHLMEHPAFTFTYADVTQELEVPVLDQIYNLACPASPADYQAMPIETLKTNILGSINLLELAVRTKARILQASTSEVYGDPLQHPQNESYWGAVNPIGIRSCYNEGKRCAEALFFDHHRKFGTEIKIARIFNTYGPRMRKNDGRVVSNFIVQALSGKELTINGEGKQTRSFCFVDDMVRGLIKLMNSDASLMGPVNLGNPEEISIKKLADKILSLTNSMSQIAFLKIPQDDPSRRCPDISLADKALGWKPEKKLDEGLARTIEYFRSLN